jgi:hypothetical protein
VIKEINCVGPQCPHNGKVYLFEDGWRAHQRDGKTVSKEFNSKPFEHPYRCEPCKKAAQLFGNNGRGYVRKGESGRAFRKRTGQTTDGEGWSGR